MKAVDGFLLQRTFLEFLDRFPILAYLWDPGTGTFLWMNPFGCAFHGKTLEQIKALSPLEAKTLIHPDDLPHVEGPRQVMQREFPRGRWSTFIPVEVRRRAPDGTFGWFLTWETLVEREGSPGPVVLAFSQDISQRKRVEAALAERDSNLKVILDNMSDVIWVCDLRMRFTFVTPSVQLLLGYTPEEVIGMGPSVTLPPESLQIVSQALIEELAREAAQPGTGGRRRLHIEQNRREGGTVWTEVITSFLRDENGQVVAVAGVTRDYTLRREAELLERRLREELEQRVVERTAELQALNQRLAVEIEERRRAQREALMAVEQERHRLGQDLHDDLCQRLVGAMCLAKSLEEPGLKHREPALAKGMGIIHDILGQAVEQVRLLARGLCALPFDTDRLEDALQLLAQDSRRLYAITCRYNVKGAIPEFPTGTAIYLVRIAQEAINNAVRHGRADHVDLTLRGTGTHVTLDIKDNGSGIRGDPFAKPGLGVRNMRSRAEMLQGTLVIEPGRSGGTRVSVAIPLDRLPGS